MRLIGKGKVRDLYAVDEDRILFVASDRVSAFDVVLENCTIPNKGRHLTRLSVFWFNFLGPITRHHLLSAQPEIELTGLGEEFQGRSLLVQRCEVLPLEAIVRGYLCGSAWSEYSRSGTINGEVMPEGLSLYDKLPRPLFTPTTKAELGEGGHDLPLTWAELTQRIGPELADRVKQTALKIYETVSLLFESHKVGKD